jgi:hypothetical protein
MGRDPTESHRSGLRCLIADDNESILVAVDETLRAERIDVVGTARSGPQLLSLLQERSAVHDPR